MKSFISKICHDVVTSSFVDLLKLGIFAVVGYLISQVTISGLSNYIPNFAQWPLTILIILVATFSLSYLVSLLKGVKPNFKAIEPSFEFEEFSIEIKYIDAVSLRYTKSKILKSLKNNIRSFTDKYCWTGDKDLEIEVKEPHQVFIEKGKSNVWTIYDVDFQRALKKNDIEDVTLSWNVTDRDGTFVPFISAVIDQPTKKFSLKLDGTEIVDRITKVYVEISAQLGATDPYETIELSSENGVYVYSIDNPKLLHHYEMRWIVVD